YVSIHAGSVIDQGLGAGMALDDELKLDRAGLTSSRWITANVPGHSNSRLGWCSAWCRERHGALNAWRVHIVFLNQVVSSIQGQVEWSSVSGESRRCPKIETAEVPDLAQPAQRGPVPSGHEWIYLGIGHGFIQFMRHDARHRVCRLVSIRSSHKWWIVRNTSATAPVRIAYKSIFQTSATNGVVAVIPAKILAE